MAGPGTGKTQVLAARIANILRMTDTAPQNILALTFTESAAKNMRERVVSMIGRAGFYVEITTFHSFCTSVIATYPEFFPIERTSQPVGDIERFDIIREIIRELPLEALKPLNTPYFYVKEILRAISELKREGVTVEDFKRLVQDSFDDSAIPEKKTEKLQFEKQKAKNEELAQIYALYQERLRARAKFDFDDMVTLVVQAFRDQEMLLRDYQEKFHYFLVDEYQDTNTAQNEVVQQLASFWGEEANIFVVGDPHQSIYRFQGASTENVLGFIERYPLAQVITLDTSYRSPQELQDTARRLIQHNTSGLAVADGLPATKTLQAALTKPLRSLHSRADAVEIWTASTQTMELIQVAEQIKELLANNTAPEEIAVLYRNNREVVELADILEKWGISYEIDGGSNVFEFEPIRQLIKLFQVIDAVKLGQEDEVLFEVLCYDWLQHDVLSVYQITHLASRSKQSLKQIFKAGFIETNEKYPNLIEQIHFDALAAFMAKLQRWVVLDAQMALSAWFELILEESGFLSWMKQQKNLTEILLYLNTFCDFVKRLANSQDYFKLSHLLATINTMQTYGIPLIVQDVTSTQNAVHLSTVHRAKGREWQYVFVIHCLEGTWGNTRERNLLPLPSGLLHHTDVSKKERNEDDRRLLYVALTRAKEKCFVSYPETMVSDNRLRPVAASMFIYELQEGVEHLQPKQNAALVEQQEEYLTRLVSPVAPVNQDARTEAFFQNLVGSFKLSVTSLNNYLHDPQLFILQDLLRIPQSKKPHLAFGTAIHAAMEELYRQIIASGHVTDKEKIFTLFEKIFRSEIPLWEETERQLQHGRFVLEQYMGQLAEHLVKPWQVERSFGRGYSSVLLDDIALTGRIDRFDWVDPTKKLVRVVDYKTGTAKSKNTIFGKTVAADLSAREQELPEGIRGKYQRQLVFYKLLTDLDRSFTPSVVEGSFEFVEPDKKTGKITRHTFSLQDSDVEDLKELIRTVMKEIRALQFLDVLPSLSATVAEQSTQH